MKEITSQASAWDQIALKRYGNERQMDVLLPVNPDEVDALLFQGGVEVAIPDVEPLAVRSLPPWERL